MSDVRRRLAAASILLLVAAGVNACGSSEDAVPAGKSEAEVLREQGASVREGDARTCEPPATIPTDEVADLIPKGLTLPDGAVVVGKVDEPTHVTVTAQLDASSGATPTTLQREFRSQIETAGYKVTGTDNEGHESEVFFAFDDGRKATVQSVNTSCPPDTVRIIISYLRVAD